MTTSVLAGPVYGVNLLVPSTWYEFDIHPATRDDTIRDLVQARIKERPELAEHKSSLAKALRKSAREAWSSGVIYFGAMAEIVEDEAMTACIAITVTDARDETSGEVAPNDVAAIMTALKPIPHGRRPTDPWREVQVVELPDAGVAARTAGIEDIEMPNDQRIVRMAMMQTFVPFPLGDPRVAIISASSPQLALTEPMLALFDGISSTFCFVYAEPEKTN
jgi:hypothetical protein